MRRMLLAIWALVLFATPLSAAGTATVTVTELGGGLRQYAIAWTATSGSVSGNSFAVPSGGELLQVIFVPGADSHQPTDQYDVTLVTEDGVDVLGGAGGDLSNAAGAIATNLGVWFDAASPTLDLVVANAGTGKSGTVRLLVRHF